MRHSHFAHAFADRFDITGIAEAKALNAGNNFRLSFLIDEA
jgi:hypothetical protein